MTETYIVVENPRDWAPFQTDERVIGADEYLFGKASRDPAGTRVINLCRGYRFAKRAVVIEVNDNPNLDAGVEDAYLGPDLYRLVLEEFQRRLELKRRA